MDDYMNYYYDDVNSDYSDDETQEDLTGFYEECVDMYSSFKNWAERNGLPIFEKLTHGDIEEFICCDFSFDSETMDSDNSKFQFWKKYYENWIKDFIAYETGPTYFQGCPNDNLCWFMFKTSSGKITPFV